MRPYTVLLSCLLLPGCAAEEQQEASESLKQAVASCQTQHPNARGTMVARVQCIAAARSAYFDRVGNRDGDLEAILEADALVNAIKVDSGTMTPQEFSAAMAIEYSNAVSTAETRQQQRAQAAAAMMAAMPPPAPIYIPPAYAPASYQMPVSRPTFCTSTNYVPGQIQTSCQ